MKVDEETKAKMDALRDVNWSEVIRRSMLEKIETEERLRIRIDRPGLRGLRMRWKGSERRPLVNGAALRRSGSGEARR